MWNRPVAPPRTHGSLSTIAHLLGTHYREVVNYDERALAAADTQARTMTMAAALPPSGSGEALATGRYTDQFFEAMDDDLRTPRAIAALADLTAEIRSAHGGGHEVSAAQAVLRELGSVLGLHLGEGPVQSGGKGM